MMSNIIGKMGDHSTDFARAFGDSLKSFLHGKGLSYTDAANLLGMGRKGVSRLSTYCHDSPRGTRATPSAELLYAICSGLEFEFEYGGCKISALTLRVNGSKGPTAHPYQLPLPFDRQFNLTDDKGTVSVSVKRPAGRVEVSISLKAAS